MSELWVFDKQMLCDSKETPTVIHDENDTFYEENEDDTLNENKIPVISSERATYIMNVCTGRILIADINASRLLLWYPILFKECYTDLKNGEILR
jgi:hypothetical protein